MIHFQNTPIALLTMMSPRGLVHSFKIYNQLITSICCKISLILVLNFYLDEYFLYAI